VQQQSPRRIRVGIVFAHWWGVGGGLHRALATIVNVLSERNFDVEVLNYGIPRMSTLRELHTLRRIPSRIHGTRYSKYVPSLLVDPIMESWMILKMVQMSKRVDLVVFIGPTHFHPARFVPYSRAKVIVYQIGPKWRRMPEIMASATSYPKKVLQTLVEETWPVITGPSRKHYYMVHDNWAKALAERDYRLIPNRVLGLPAPSVTQTPDVRKENNVIDFGRFHPEKRHELSVEIIEKVVRKMSGVKLYVVGLANLPGYADRVLSNLTEMINQKSLQRNVVTLKDLPYDKVVELMKSCKIILSNQTEPEAYLLTLMEGMAHGCVPVVPQVRRGAWDDILDSGNYGFGFRTVDDAAETVVKILSLPDDEYRRLSDRAAGRAADLSEEHFGDSLVSAIREVLARRR
jgi:glycosyltransferase involved in cell wall biosynthesis